jgi:hypothetical protein
VVEELTYYTFKDEAGVTHLTDAPVDPRYRMVTVQITISRGLAPFRRLSLDKLRPVILRAARRYRLDPALIAAVIKAESAFDPKAVSWAGARGLMQLMPNTAKLMGVKDSFDPEQNVMGGSRYLREMLNRFGGDLTLAVAAYNCGPERVARVRRVPDIAETRNYVRTVKANLEMLGPLFSAEEAAGATASAPSTYVSYPDPMNAPLDAAGPEAFLGAGHDGLPGGTTADPESATGRAPAGGPVLPPPAGGGP